MRKATLFFGLVYGILACGGPQEKKGADRFDLSSHQITMEIGEVLFLTNCDSCHPQMKGRNLLVERYRASQKDFSALQKFVRNQDSLIKAGDLYTLELNKKWGKQTYRHSFTLTDVELKALFYYLETTF